MGSELLRPLVEPLGGSAFAPNRLLCGYATSRVGRTRLLFADRSPFRWGAGADQQHRGHEVMPERDGGHHLQRYPGRAGSYPYFGYSSTWR